MEKKEIVLPVQCLETDLRPGRPDIRVRDKMTYDVNIEDDIVERERV